jgi:pilus assembly protein CpaB
MLRAIILVVAIGAGSLAAWLVLSMQPGDAAVTPQAAPAQATSEVLVAAVDLPQGHVLDAKSLRWQAWPKDAVSPSFISRSVMADAVNSLTGAAVRGRFVAGEPILEEKLSRSPSGMLAAMLPAGKRAVAIRISAESTAGGFILPNDRVDVIQNIVRQEGGHAENRSRTLLSNIRVLAVDQRADEAKGQSVVVGKTATLELSPSQAEIIVSGQVAGTLSLALRSVADIDEKVAITPDDGGMVRILRAGRSEIIRVQ